MTNEQPERITADELDAMQKRFVKKNTGTDYGFGSGISDFDIPMDAALGEQSISRRIAQDRQRQQSKEAQLIEDGIRLIAEVRRLRAGIKPLIEGWNPEYHHHYILYGITNGGMKSNYDLSDYCQRLLDGNECSKPETSENKND